MSDAMWGLDVTWLLLTKGSLVLGLAWFFSSWLEYASASRRHLVWLLALVALLALPWVDAAVPDLELAWLPAQAKAEPVFLSVLPEPPAVTSQGTVPVERPLDVELGAEKVRASEAGVRGPVLWTAIWGLGSLLLLVRLGSGLLALRRLQREASPFRHTELPQMMTALHGGAFGHRAEVLCHGEVDAPCTWGVLRPVILLPESANDWDIQTLRDVLAHEMAHVVRRDWLGHVVAKLACALCWFQPLAWWAASRLRLEAERACDDRVLVLGTDAPDYAERLVGLARDLRRARPWYLDATSPAVALDMARRPQLSHRIAAILNPDLRRHSMNRSFFWIATLLALATLTIIGPSNLVHAGNYGPVDEVSEELIAAATRGDLADVERLIAEGADVNARLGGQGSSLILAALGGHTEIVAQLLEAGADPELAETRGPRTLPRTPLGAAAVSGDVETVDLLLEAGAEVDQAPRGDATPLMIAAERGHDVVTARLLEAGADVNIRIPGDGTPLIAAARGGSPEVMRQFLEVGVSVDIAVPGDGHPLLVASQEGHRESVQLLVDAGADVDQAVRGDGTALLKASDRGQKAIVEILLSAGADPNRSVRGDGSPLIAASRAGHLEVVQLLLDAGARVDQGVKGDGNALIRAAAQGDLVTVQALLAAGADPDAAVRGDGNPLIAAARGGHNDVVTTLLDAGAAVNAIVPGDETPLIQASWNGHLETVQLLLDRGANAKLQITVESWIGGGREVRSPLTMAQKGGHDDIVQLLRQHGATS